MFHSDCCHKPAENTAALILLRVWFWQLYSSERILVSETDCIGHLLSYEDKLWSVLNQIVYTVKILLDTGKLLNEEIVWFCHKYLDGEKFTFMDIPWFGHSIYTNLYHWFWNIIGGEDTFNSHSFRTSCLVFILYVLPYFYCETSLFKIFLNNVCAS